MTSDTFLLELGDPKTQDTLSTGWLRTSNTERQRVIARKLLPSREGRTKSLVLFEKIDSRLKRPKGIGSWLQAARAFSLTATGTPCLAVLILCIARGDSLNLGFGVCALFGVIALQVAINIFNDVEDYRRLIDLPGTLGGSGVIQNGWWTPLELRRIAWMALVTGGMLGLPAVVHQPRLLLPISVLAGVGVLLYSGKKMGLKYVALGDIAVWILCGPALTIGFSGAIAQTRQSFAPGDFWIGAFFGFLAMAILHVNNLQDMKLDLDRGVQTLAIRLGFRGR